MKTNPRLRNALLVSMLAFSASAYSQVDSAELNQLTLRELLDVKVTTASKTLQSSDLASAVVKVITRDQIRSRGYQSLLDVLFDLPDFKIDDKMYSGIRNSATVRGAQGSEKLLILLDGVNIAGPSGEALPIMQNYPVNLAEQIEILYGPASALYGANAVSGIINIISRKTPRKNLTVEASTTAGMYGYTNSTLFLTKKWSDKTMLTVSGQYYYDKQPDYTEIYKGDPQLDPGGLQTGTFNSIYGPTTPVTSVRPGYEAPMSAHNMYLAFQSGDFTFNVFRNYSRVPTSLENNTSNNVFNKDVFMGQATSMVNAAYKKSWDRLTSTTSLTGSNYRLSPESNYRNLYTAMEPAYKYSVCSMLKGEEQLDYRASKVLSMTGGVGVEHYNSVPQSGDLAKPMKSTGNVEGTYVGTQAFYNPQGLEAQFYFVTYYNAGAYYQLQYSPSRKLNVTAGARYDYNSRYGSTLNPRMGIVLQPVQSTTIKVLFGTAFRAPSPSDAYSQYGAFETDDSGRTYHSHFLHLANPDLKPIKSLNTELNITHRFSDNLMISVDGYYTALRDLFSGADDNATTKKYNNSFHNLPVDYIEVFVNRKKQHNYGGSMELSWKHNIGAVSLRSSASVSYVNGIIKGGMNEYNEWTNRMEIDFISPWTGRIGTDLKVGKFTCSPRLLIVGKQRVPGIEDVASSLIKRQKLDGYELLNISMAYQLSKNISFSLTGTNVLDQRYRNVSFNMDLKASPTELYYGQPQDPIRVMAGVHFSLN